MNDPIISTINTLLKLIEQSSFSPELKVQLKRGLLYFLSNQSASKEQREEYLRKYLEEYAEKLRLISADAGILVERLELQVAMPAKRFIPKPTPGGGGNTKPWES